MRYDHLPQKEQIIRGRDGQRYSVTGYQSSRSFIGFTWKLGETAELNGTLDAKQARDLANALLAAAEFIEK